MLQRTAMTRPTKRQEGEPHRSQVLNQGEPARRPAKKRVDRWVEPALPMTGTPKPIRGVQTEGIPSHSRHRVRLPDLDLTQAKRTESLMDLEIEAVQTIVDKVEEVRERVAAKIFGG